MPLQPALDESKAVVGTAEPWLPPGTAMPLLPPWWLRVMEVPGVPCRVASLSLWGV